MITAIILSRPTEAGKSSLTGILPKYLGTNSFYESVDDSPALSLFYENPKRYAFLLQVYFLNIRFQSIRSALADDNNILDRSIYEDTLFFQMNAGTGRTTKEEIDTYHEPLHSMMSELDRMPKKSPDPLVHIDIPYDTTSKRTQKRSRNYEQLGYDPTPGGYYKRLFRYYKPRYERYDYSPKMTIGGDKFDLTVNEKDRQEVLNQIVAKLKEMGKLGEDWKPNLVE